MSRDQRAEVLYFTPAKRLREVWRIVNGEPIEAWFARRPERCHRGRLICRRAVVGEVWDDGGLVVLKAGGTVWNDDGPR